MSTQMMLTQYAMKSDALQWKLEKAHMKGENMLQ